MSTYDVAAELRDSPLNRRVLSLVEVIAIQDPSIRVRCVKLPTQTEFNCLQWENPSDSTRWASSKLEEFRVAATIDAWIITLMEECNIIQRKALALHTISQTTPLTQKTVYELKFAAAVEYKTAVEEWQALNSTTDLPTHEQVPCPNILKSEADVTGDPYYYLALAIIANWTDSQVSLATFFGQLEGERRATKARISACTTVAELESLTWANWPAYEGNPPTPTE
ncbi:hypothetical protein BN7874_172 [Phage NCTB]|nr:hypothetical protein BN7874_172 [Phage NCTB]